MQYKADMQNRSITLKEPTLASPQKFSNIIQKEPTLASPQSSCFNA